MNDTLIRSWNDLKPNLNVYISSLAIELEKLPINCDLLKKKLMTSYTKCWCFRVNYFVVKDYIKIS